MVHQNRRYLSINCYIAKFLVDSVSASRHSPRDTNTIKSCANSEGTTSLLVYRNTNSNCQTYLVVYMYSVHHWILISLKRLQRNLNLNNCKEILLLNS